MRVTFNGVELGIKGDKIYSPSSKKERAFWNIFIVSFSDVQFPEFAYLEPWCDTVECNFDFEGSIKSSGLNIDQLCNNVNSETWVRYSAYRIKRNASALYVIERANYGGMGGNRNDLVILFHEPRNIYSLCHGDFSLPDE